MKVIHYTMLAAGLAVGGYGLYKLNSPTLDLIIGIVVVMLVLLNWSTEDGGGAA